MKIIVALDNENIKDMIEEKYRGSVFKYDISNMESVIELLSKPENNLTVDYMGENGLEERIVVITRDDLKGNLTSRMYIKQLKLANSKAKIVLITKNLDDEFKQFLFANEVFNIIEGDRVSIDTIEEQVNTDNPVIYKLQDVSLDNKEQGNKETDRIGPVISREVFAVFGTSGAGKSYIANLLSKNLNEKLNIKTTIIDMDFLNPITAILNNIDLPYGSINQIVDELDKSKHIESFDKYYYINKNEKNLQYLTNNTTLYECQNKFSMEYYKRIYEAAKRTSDFVVIDLPSSPFVDVVKYTLQHATKLVFVINPNYLSVKQAIKYLALINKIWQVPNTNIMIVVNKIQKDSLDVRQIENLIGDFQIVSKVDFNQKLEGYLNGFRVFSYEDMDIKEILKFLGITKNDDKNNNIKRTMFLKIGKKDMLYDSKFIRQ